jgi:anti-sigma28 factor (negative regulator of flagellin synthesis)
MEDNMKIDDKDILSSSLQNIAKTAAGKSSVQSASSSVSSGAPSDAVDLSGYGRVIANGLAAGESARSARIDQLREIYVKGQYRVDAQELSRAIVDAHLSGG